MPDNERRIINGAIYEKTPNGIVLVGPAPAAEQPMRAMPSATVLPMNPVRAAREAQDRARQDEADARARRDQAAQEERDRRAALEWTATHNPDGTKKVDETPDKLANIPAAGATGIQENIATLRKIRDAIAALDPTKGRPESVGPGTGALGQTFTNWNDPQGTNTRAAISQVGAQKIHDLSGAAVSASEAPRFMPFVPTVSDPPEVALEKLKNFERNLTQQIGEAANFYSPANGYRPYTTPGLAEIIGGKPDSAPSSSGGATPPGGSPTPDNGPVKGFDPRTLGGAAEGYAAPSESALTGYKDVPNPDKEKAYWSLVQFLNTNPTEAQVRNFIGGRPIYPSGLADDIVKYHAATNRYAIQPGQTSDQVPLSAAELDRNYTESRPDTVFYKNFTNDAVGGLPRALANSRLFDPTGARGAATDAADATHPNYATAGKIAGTATGALAAELGAVRAARAFGLGPEAAARWAPRIADPLYGAVSGAAGDPNNPVMGAVKGGLSAFTGGVMGRGVGGVAASRYRPNAAERDIHGAIINSDPALVGNTLREAQGLNLPMTLADTSAQLGSLGRAAVRNSPNASAIASAALRPRSLGQIDRFQGAIERDLGPIGNIPQLTDDMMKAARAKAAPLYDQAYAAPPISSPQIDSLLGTPFGKQGLGRAVTIAKNERVDPNTLSVQFDAAGDPVMMPTPSTRTLDFVKRGMDDVLEQYRNPVTGKLNLDEMGRAQLGVKNDLLTEMDRVNPAYGEARAAFAGPAQETDFIRRGRDAFKQPPDKLAFDMQNVAPDKLPLMQLGYRDALSQTGDKVGFSSNPFDRTLGSPEAQSRLETMYPGNPGNARFLRQAELERQMQETSNGILGGSRTAENLIADNTFKGDGVSVLGGALADSLGGIPVNTAMNAGKFGLRKMFGARAEAKAAAKADAMAPILLKPNAEESLAELARVLAGMQRYNRASGTAKTIGGINGVGGGLLLESILGQ